MPDTDQTTSPMDRLNLRIANAELAASSDMLQTAERARSELSLLYILRDFAAAISGSEGAQVSSSVDLSPLNARLDALTKRIDDIEAANAIDFGAARAATTPGDTTPPPVVGLPGGAAASTDGGNSGNASLSTATSE